MKNRFTNFVVAGLLCLTLVACNDQQPAAQQTTQAPSQQTQASVPASLPVADNLLADNWVIVFDGSGSMGDPACGTGGTDRIKVAKAAVKKFVTSIPDEANLGLVYFGWPHGGNAKVEMKLGTKNRAEFNTLVDKMSSSGGTPLVDSIRLGGKMLDEQSQRQRGYGTYRILVVTDGESGDGNPSYIAKELVLKKAYAVHVIGFCIDGTHLLDVKGYTQYVGANNPAALEQGLKAVLAEGETYVDSQFVGK